MRDNRTRPELPDPEQVIEFKELYDTHRMGIYKGWMVIQPLDEMDGEILCFLPDDSLHDGGYDSLEYIKDFHTPEWEAGNLNEIIDFIDSY